MSIEDKPAPAEQEQIELLEKLVARARAKGIHTGIRDDELQDLSEDQAAELIEQLSSRLGETRG